MNGLKNPCHNPLCQHERDSHYFDEFGSGDCLALHCECRGFASAKPKSKTQPGTADDEWGTGKPHADTTCKCRECQLWTARRVSRRYGFGGGYVP